LEALVGLEIVVWVAVGTWLAVLVLAISLCRMAKRGDEAMRTVVARPDRHDETRRSRAPSPGTPLRTLDLDHAAALLGVSPEMLLAWEVRYGFPSSSRAEPRYSESEVLALRESLGHSPSIPSAMSEARERIRRRRVPTAGGLVDHRDGGLAS
jgi:hypothetical protein